MRCMNLTGSRAGCEMEYRGMRYESDGKCRYAGLAVIVRIVAQTLCFSKNEAESPNIAGLSFKNLICLAIGSAKKKTPMH
mgnify:FL=1